MALANIQLPSGEEISKGIGESAEEAIAQRGSQQAQQAIGASGTAAVGGSTASGLPDLFDQAAETAIKRLGASQRRQRENLQQGFTQRGLRESGLASGAVEQLGKETARQQREIERQRLNKLAQLAKSRQGQGTTIIDKTKGQNQTPSVGLNIDQPADVDRAPASGLNLFGGGGGEQQRQQQNQQQQSSGGFDFGF